MQTGMAEVMGSNPGQVWTAAQVVWNITGMVMTGCFITIGYFELSLFQTIFLTPLRVQTGRGLGVGAHL